MRDACWKTEKNREESVKALTSSCSPALSPYLSLFSSLVGVGGMRSQLVGTGSGVAFPPCPCFDATYFLIDFSGIGHGREEAHISLLGVGCRACWRVTRQVEREALLLHVKSLVAF